MKDETKPLDAGVLTALRAALPLVEAPADRRARILSAVEGRIATLPPGGCDPAGGAGGAPGPQTPVSATPSGIGWIASHPLVALSAALVVGGAIGAWLRGGPPAERIVYVDRIVAASAATASAAAPSPPETTTSAAVPVESLPFARAVAPAPAPADSGQQLAAESTLLDVARAALARGEAAPALDAVARHGSQFPHGMLVEEREALAVKALVLAGRDDEARARAGRFRDRYPQSMFLPAIDAKLKAVR